ncbi:ketol-acid reductoisomerase [Ignicoccus pacificus DSM 13166]|uniref:Ketol-acid reductoisomerase (NADP(+)) n=1 Tax=Ignicoccus pacificus DSM 13166 TaxID=940294 RepID=A0A977K9C1_9CREN|nr:ketol-acid reductoisomerase [Ignicoccus pacificus DSM 13166]
MAQIWKDDEVSLEPLKGRKVAVIGYGSQGRAWALNMRDSGIDVVVGLRPEGKSWKLAEQDGFKPKPIPEAAKEADVIIMLIPDMAQPEIYEKYIEPNLKEGDALVFAHGFNIHFGLIKPPKYVDVVMVAPKSPGPKVREAYEQGRGVPALVAVHQDATGKAWDLVLAIAKAIGCTRAGVIKTTFKEETETDLIGEQTVLVGGLMELLLKGFENLVELGYQPEVAYFEAINEAKLIMDLIWQYGFYGMLKRVSDTAKYGGLTVGPKVIDEHVKENMKKASERVLNGEFAKEWVEEYKKGMPTLNELMEKVKNHPAEKVGKELRKMMGLEE